MMPNDQVGHVLELANRYHAPAVGAANQGLSVYRSIEPQLRELQRVARQVREAEDYPRYLLIRTFTFARGGWHDAPLLKMPVRQFRSIVNDLVDKADEKVKGELDAEIPNYFRHNDHAALQEMIEGWDLFADHRRRALEDACGAHKSSKYTLSVPTLAPQIEGILREETGEYGRGTVWIKKVNNALGFEYDAASRPPAPNVKDLAEAVNRLATLDMPERWREAERIELLHALFRVNELYNHGDFSDPRFVTSTNRHAILHGVADDFSELASVKLFCAVQLVHEIVVAYRDAIGRATVEPE